MVDSHDENEVILEDEVLPENTDMEAGEAEELLGNKLKNLQKKLAGCEEERRKSLEDLSRARADFLNSKKRNEEQLVRDRERITERHIEELLPLADSFEMALKDPAWAAADPKWRSGVEGIYAQLINLFKGYGVEVLNPAGQEFNPHEHEALIDGGAGSTISTVIQSGYKMGNKVLRPAKVAVGTA
jgi:molecular chaperone GrpE